MWSAIAISTQSSNMNSTTSKNERPTQPLVRVLQYDDFCMLQTMSKLNQRALRIRRYYKIRFLWVSVTYVHEFTWRTFHRRCSCILQLAGMENGASVFLYFWGPTFPFSKFLRRSQVRWHSHVYLLTLLQYLRQYMRCSKLMNYSQLPKVLVQLCTSILTPLVMLDHF